MDDEIMECLGDKGFMYYNRLREFYDEPERVDVLQYIVRYTLEELAFLDIDDEKQFREKVRLRGYLIVKNLYDKNIERLNSGEKTPLPLKFLTDEQIRDEIKEKYAELEKKIIGEE